VHALICRKALIAKWIDDAIFGVLITPSATGNVVEEKGEQ
jgi:hypothetical protein